MLSHDMFICVCAFICFGCVTLYFSVNYASSNDTSSILSEPLIRVTVISAVFRCFRLISSDQRSLKGQFIELKIIVPVTS